MKICLVTRALPLHRLGGLEFHVADLAAALARAGIEVHVLSSAQPQTQDAWQPREGVVVHHLPRGRAGDYSAAFFRLVGPELRRLHARHNYDLVHFQEFAGTFATGALDVRTVTTVHGTLTTETPLYRHYFRRLGLHQQLRAVWRFKHRLVLMPFYLRALEASDALLVDSDFTRREVLLHWPHLRPRIHLVPLGVDFSRYRSEDTTQAETGHLRVLVLGRLQMMKGIGVALKAMHILRQRSVPVKLTIAGRGNELPAIRQMIQSLRVGEMVQFRGAIPVAEMSDLFHQHDILLFPDLTQPAFGLVAVEAMAHELPVVGARSGAIPEVVTDETGWIYDPWNPVELATLLEQVLEQGADRARKSSAARQRALSYTSEAMAAKTVAVYEEIIATTGGASI